MPPIISILFFIGLAVTLFNFYMEYKDDYEANARRQRERESAERAAEERAKKQEENFTEEQLRVKELSERGLQVIEDCGLLLPKGEVCYLAEDPVSVTNCPETNPRRYRDDIGKCASGTLYITNKRLMIHTYKYRFECNIEEILSTKIDFSHFDNDIYIEIVTEKDEDAVKYFKFMVHPSYVYHLLNQVIKQRREELGW